MLKVIQLQLAFDLSGVECEMSRQSAENLDPWGTSATSNVIKCVVMFYERGTSGNIVSRGDLVSPLLTMVAIISSGRKNSGQF